MKITIKEVAKEAGVSIATVSRVLNGRDRIKPSTRLKVEKVIERLNFKPDFTARTMINKQTKTIGLIVPQLSNEYYAQLAEAIEEELWVQGYTLILSTSSSIKEGGREKEFAALQSLAERKVDGIIFGTSYYIGNVRYPLIHELIERGIPIVAYDQKIPGISQVNGDHLNGSMDAVTHLIRLGHKKIAYIGGPFVSPERELGYRNALMLHGLTVEDSLIRRGKPGFKFGFDAMSELIESGEPFTGVFCGNDLIAMGAIQSLDNRGLKAPDDIAVVGYDDINMASLIKPRLTTIRQPIRQMGAAIVELLIEAIETKKPPKQLLFPMELVVRETCGQYRQAQTIP